MEALTRDARGASHAGHIDHLFRTHHRHVLAYCMRRMGPSDAEEVAAEVFAIAWRRRADAPVENALPWLYGIARKAAANHHRSSRRFRRLRERIGRSGGERPPQPDLVVIRRLEDHQMLMALDRLSERDREVLRLAVWEGLSHRDIATILGCREAAVSKRISRARARLAKQLEEGS